MFGHPSMRRIGWFVLLWAASVTVLALIGGAIKLVLSGAA